MMLTQVRHWLIAVTIGALCAPSAFSFNVGPYRLGMSNSEAAKVGIHDCKDVGSFVRCAAQVRARGTSHRAQVTFDRKTKRLIEVVAVVKVEGRGGRIEEEIQTDLNMAPCHAQDSEDDGMKCHRRSPLSTRSIQFEFGPYGNGFRHYKVSARLNSGAAHQFYVLKPELRKKEKDLKVFEAGR